MRRASLTPCRGLARSRRAVLVMRRGVREEEEDEGGGGFLVLFSVLREG